MEKGPQRLMGRGLPLVPGQLGHSSDKCWAEPVTGQGRKGVESGGPGELAEEEGRHTDGGGAGSKRTASGSSRCLQSRASMDSWGMAPTSWTGTSGESPSAQAELGNGCPRALTILHVRNWFQKEAPSSRLNRTPPGTTISPALSGPCRPQEYHPHCRLKPQGPGAASPSRQPGPPGRPPQPAL